MKVSFVIPCYNSEKTIENVVNEIISTIQKRSSYQYEIVLVNDCSKDNVWDEIKRLAAKDENIKGISFAKNFGQHSALMAGYNKATGDVIVSLDDDGQTPADEVYSLIDKLDEGYDVVYASYEQKKHSFARNIGTKINNVMCEKLLGKPKGLMITSFFVARKFVIDEAKKYQNSYAYVPGLILRTC
jgi:undecaprenyl-phosphate 4-deoxy-4-formamido-L-arabinose transferase